MANDITDTKIDIAEGGPARFLKLTAVSLAASGVFVFPVTPIMITQLKHRELYAAFEKLAGSGTLGLDVLWIDDDNSILVAEDVPNGSRIYPKAKRVQFRVKETSTTDTVTDGAAAVGMR